jgi:uncharacterized repeat protein (TIGR03803 family)
LSQKFLTSFSQEQFPGTTDPQNQTHEADNKAMKYKERNMHSSTQKNCVINDSSKTFNQGPKLRSIKLVNATLRGAFSLAVLSALLLAGVHSAQAQTENVLYNFLATPDGGNPTASVTFNGANIFGTTYNGGEYGYGSVFELTPNGTGGWNESLLYSFCPASPSCTDGESPTLSYVIFDSEGNLYGTTNLGGANGDGEVFELSPSGNTWKETVLYSFAGSPDAANPINGLIADASGNLYGVGYAGGTGNNGAVFELVKSGSSWTELVIADVSSSYAALTLHGGNIFGVAYAGIFEMTPNGKGWNAPTTLYTFNPADAATEGSQPNGTLAFDSAGNIYGTTTSGGKSNDGTVYKLTLGAKGAYTESLLGSFTGTVGATPYAGLVFDSAGDIFGTTTAGGKNNAGIVFELKKQTGKAAYQPRILQTFIGENGAAPYAPLVLNGGYLYGTTFGGGSDGNGTVFVVNPAAGITKTVCVSSLNPSTEGQPVTFTATITSSNGQTPDGVVVFEPVGQSTLVNGVATYTTSSLPAGSTKITAVYQGDLNFLTSHSVSFEQVVNK